MNPPRKTDLIIIAVVSGLALVFSLISWFFFADQGGAVYAEIYHDNRLVFRTDLSSAAERTFSVPGKPDVVFQIFADNSIAFIKSDCPDQVCIHMGRIKAANQFAACLPNKLMLKTVSKNKVNESPDLIVK